MAEAHITGADQLKRMRLALRAAPKEMRAEVVKQLRTAVKPVQKSIQTAVRSAPSQASKSSSARRRRAAKALNANKGISEYRAREIALKTGKTTAEVMAEAEARRVARAAAGSGLRESIARTVSTSVTASGPAGVNATFRTRSDRMPNLQRKLPKDFNNPRGWRHPVYGDRETWVHQTGTPYFDVTIEKHQEDLVKGVSDAVQRIAEKLATEGH